MPYGDKSLISKTFKVIGKKNIKYTIFITINTYNININKSNIQLII